jgi:hypothetical protein
MTTIHSRWTTALVAAAMCIIVSEAVTAEPLESYYQEARCGPNCLYAICVLKARKCSLAEICELSGMTNEGSTMLGLLEAAEKLGLPARAVKGQAGDVNWSDNYAIAHLKKGHFVVVVGRSPDELVIIDPPKEPYLLRKEEFAKEWSGYALLFDRGKAPASADQRDAKAAAPPLSLTAMGSAKENMDMARTLLAAIARDKSTRDALRAQLALLNQPAADLDVGPWLTDTQVKLADLRGSIVMLEFWSTRCGPCMGPDTVKSLNALLQGGGHVPVYVIAIHEVTDDLDSVKNAVKARGMEFSVCVDRESEDRKSGKTFVAYHVRALPCAYIIDVAGKVRAIETIAGPSVEELIDEAISGVEGRTESDAAARWGLKIAPTAVRLGNISSGAKKSTSIFIYKPDQPDLVVEISKMPAEAVEANLTKHEAVDALLYELKVSVEGNRVGTVETTLELRTNDPDHPSIMIPVQATVVDG